MDELVVGVVGSNTPLHSEPKNRQLVDRRFGRSFMVLRARGGRVKKVPSETPEQSRKPAACAMYEREAQGRAELMVALTD